MVVSSLEGYTLKKGITGVYFYSFESIITLSLSLFYLTKLIFMKIVRFKTVGGKSLVMRISSWKHLQILDLKVCNSVNYLIILFCNLLENQ